MSLLSYNELVKLVESGVITADPANINGASIDITLDDHVMTEDCHQQAYSHPIDLMAKENISMVEKDIADGFILRPGDFILASSREVFNLPSDIVAEFVLKSSGARNGLQHLLAGYADPGWNNSKLTLELKNETRHHTLLLRKGMKIGQIKFYRVEEVPYEANYANTGQYNGQSKVQQSKGIR